MIKQTIKSLTDLRKSQEKPIGKDTTPETKSQARGRKKKADKKTKKTRRMQKLRKKRKQKVRRKTRRRMKKTRKRKTKPGG